MKRIAFDTNVLLDAICERAEAEVAKALIMEVAMERASGVVTANAITDIYSLARKKLADEGAREAIKNLLTLFDVAVVDGEICEAAVYSMMDDFEDAVFAYAAEREGVDFIATRDEGLLKSSYCPVKAYLPREVLVLVKDQGQAN